MLTSLYGVSLHTGEPIIAMSDKGGLLAGSSGPSTPRAAPRLRPASASAAASPREKNYAAIVARRRPLSARQRESSTLVQTLQPPAPWDTRRLGALPTVEGASTVGIVTRPAAGPTGRWSAGVNGYSSFGSHPLRWREPCYSAPRSARLQAPSHRRAPVTPGPGAYTPKVDHRGFGGTGIS